jgi:uncharacterized protein
MRAILLALLLATPAAADTADVVLNHIRPGHAAFAGSARALAALDTCDVQLLRPAFHQAYDDWLRVSHLRFGPAEEEGRGLAILFWPDPKGLGWKSQRRLLSEDPATLTPDALARLSIAARGLSGLERLLYPPDDLDADPCPLIRASAEDLSRMATALEQEWGAYGDLLLTAGEPGNQRFLAKDEATQVLFTQLAAGLDFIADRRLGRPLGILELPRPDLAEARASQRALRNVTLSLQALRDLAAQLAPNSPKTLAAFDHAIELAVALDDPVFDGLSDPAGWLKVEILQQAVRATRAAALAEIGPALGVGLGFNALDGD